MSSDISAATNNLIAIGEHEFDPRLFTGIDRLELSMRTSNGLKNKNLIYIGSDILPMSDDELLRTTNLGPEVPE